LPLASESRFIALTVLTPKSAGARDFHGGTKGLSNEMAGLTMIGRVPVLGLVFELQQRRLPASIRAGGRFWAGSGCGFEWLHGFAIFVASRPMVPGKPLKTFQS